MGLAVKSLPVSAGGVRVRVRSLGQKDSLEEGMVTHPSVLICRIPWTAEPGGLQSTGSQRVGHDRARRHTIKRCVPRQSVTVFSSRH